MFLSTNLNFCLFYCLYFLIKHQVFKTDELQTLQHGVLVHLELVGHLRLSLFGVHFNIISCLFQLVVSLGLGHVDLIPVLGRDFLLHRVSLLQGDTERNRERRRTGGISEMTSSEKKKEMLFEDGGNRTEILNDF